MSCAANMWLLELARKIILLTNKNQTCVDHWDIGYNTQHILGSKFNAYTKSQGKNSMLSKPQFGFRVFVFFHNFTLKNASQRSK